MQRVISHKAKSMETLHNIIWEEVNETIYFLLKSLTFDFLVVTNSINEGTQSRRT